MVPFSWPNPCQNVKQAHIQSHIQLLHLLSWWIQLDQFDLTENVKRVLLIMPICQTYAIWHFHLLVCLWLFIFVWLHRIHCVLQSTQLQCGGTPWVLAWSSRRTCSPPNTSLTGCCRVSVYTSTPIELIFEDDFNYTFIQLYISIIGLQCNDYHYILNHFLIKSSLWTHNFYLLTYWLPYPECGRSSLCYIMFNSPNMAKTAKESTFSVWFMVNNQLKLMFFIVMTTLEIGQNKTCISNFKGAQPSLQ